MCACSSILEKQEFKVESVMTFQIDLRFFYLEEPIRSMLINDLKSKCNFLIWRG